MRLIKVKDFNKFELNDMLGNLLELLVDTKKKIVYHVHPPEGHSKVASKYLHIPENEINQYNAGYLVSAIVEIESGTVKNIIVGKSSLELGHDIHHSREQLEKAKAIVESIMKLSEQLGEVRISEDVHVYS